MAVQLWETATSNGFSTTLNGTIASGDTSITLTSVTGLVAPGLLVIDRVDGSDTPTPTLREYISYTNISTKTLTGVTRGRAGSTAQSHLSNAVVEEVMSVDHWIDLVDFLQVSHNSAGQIVSSAATVSNLHVPLRLNASGASVTGIAFAGNIPVSLGSDVVNDTYYRNSSGIFARQPACSFHVTESVDTANLVNGVDTTIQFDTETYDVGSNWNTSTYLFTAPVSGYYTFYCQAYFYNGITDTNYAEVKIVKNGSTILHTGRLRANGTNEVMPVIFARVHLTATDTIKFQGAHTMGGNTPDIYANSVYTFAWGKLDIAD